MTALASGPYTLGLLMVLSDHLELELSLRSVDIRRCSRSSRPSLQMSRPAPYGDWTVLTGIIRRRMPISLWMIEVSVHPRRPNSTLVKDPEKKRLEFVYRLDDRSISNLRCRVPRFTPSSPRPSVKDVARDDKVGSGTRHSLSSSDSDFSQLRKRRRGMSEVLGSGVNHSTFRTFDIPASVRTMVLRPSHLVLFPLGCQRRGFF